jgi:carbon-monoxide dehydrogenase large subunit
MSATGIGARVRRVEDQRFITGRGQYTDDIHRPYETYAHFIRSPHAHASIKGIDTKKAEKMPGVLAILTGDDIAKDKLGDLFCGWMVLSKDGSQMKAGSHPALAKGKVRYVGDHVAVVIAESLDQAKNAAAEVRVDYGVLPAVADINKARDTKSPQLHENAPKNTVYEWVLGGAAAVDAAFKQAKHVTKIEIVNNRLIPNAIEPRAAIGEYEAGTDTYTLWSTSQNPHVLRLGLSAFIGLCPEHKFRVISPDVGGGFGSKIFIYPEETVCIWASKKVGRPVRWTAERSESFQADAHGRDHVTTAELALDGNNKMLALRVKTLANLGAYLSTFSSAVPTFLYAPLLSGQYAIPAIYCEVDGVYTNTAPVDAYRGAGRPEACYVIERIVEVAARELHMDPAELRRRNFVTSFPYQTPVASLYDAGDYKASLDKAMQLSEYKNFVRRRQESERRGKLRGVGFAAYIEACGVAPSNLAGALGCGVGLWESADIAVTPTGMVEVLTGSHSHGQGHETTFAQLVSDKLGIPMSHIAVIHGDTDKVQFGMGTYGSRSGPVGMSAIVMAVDKVIAKGKQIAAHVLEAAEADIEFKDGKYNVAGTDKSAAFGEIALAAYVAHKFPTAHIEPGLKEHAFYDPTNFTFPAGTHICEVEIDPETGTTEIVNWVAIDDFGTVINPMIVEGQVHGGIAQGVGQALLEGCVYDSDGQLVTGSYMDYTMPRADNLPSFKVDYTFTKCPSNPLGMKGCGEAGAIAAPAALMNAITNAVGHEDVPMPATSKAVWHALQKTQRRKAAE